MMSFPMDRHRLLQKIIFFIDSPSLKRQKVNNKASEISNTCNTRNIQDADKPLVHLGLSDFSKIVETRTFVDKSMFIKEILEQRYITLITAPHRFLKSTNMDMLKRFLEIQVDEKGRQIKSLPNYNLFADNNLKIFQQNKLFSEHFGKYPVIHVDFKSVRGNSFDEFVASFRHILRELYLQHKYLIESEIWSESWNNKNKFIKYIGDEKHETLSEKEIIEGLVYLSEVMHVHFKKHVFVLIDEYDAPIREAIFCKSVTDSDLENIVKFIDILVSRLLHFNQHVVRGLINARVNVGRILSPCVNHIERYQFLWDERFYMYYGFEREEVLKLLKNNNLSEKINEVKSWYSGYDYRRMYNSWSILNYLQKKSIQSYWSSGSLDHLKALLNHNQIKKEMKDLMLKRPIMINYLSCLTIYHIKALKQMINSSSEHIKQEDVDLLIQFLYENGYLNITKTDEEVEINIPNEEMFSEFRNIYQ